MHIHDFWENGVKWRIACDKKAVGNRLESVDRSRLLWYVTPDREVAFPTGLDRKWHSFPPIITIHRSITPTSKVEEL